MANLTESELWEEGIYLIEKSDRVIGGVGGISNRQASQLANRTQYLRRQMSTIVSDIEPRLLPVGAIILWGSTTLPDGWVEANGQAFDQRENPKLSEVFPSGRVPDMRGRFARGWDSSREICSFEAATDFDHYHLTGRMAGESGGSGDDAYLIVREQNWPDKSYNARGVFGDKDRAVSATLPNGLVGQILSTGNAIKSGGDNATLAPANVALIYIVKTDGAEQIPSVATPTNLIVTPSSLQLGVGNTQQFTAQVLPADLAPNYPVTWLITNTTVGTIDNSGLFTAAAAGETDIIASISSGLNVRVSVRVDSLLTAITLSAIPDQNAGDTYQLSVIKTPENATEDLIYTSTNNAVASVSNDGLLIAGSGGTAMIRVTGALSGVTARRSVNVTDVPRDDDYLTVGNRLSEFKELGAEAQAQARENLGITDGGDVAISTDYGNALTTGSDGGLFVDGSLGAKHSDDLVYAPSVNLGMYYGGESIQLVQDLDIRIEKGAYDLHVYIGNTHTETGQQVGLKSQLRLSSTPDADPWSLLQRITPADSTFLASFPIPQPYISTTEEYVTKKYTFFVNTPVIEEDGNGAYALPIYITYKRLDPVKGVVQGMWIAHWSFTLRV